MNFSPNTKESILLESGTNEVEFIEFFLGKISYGINVSKVQRVVAKSAVKITGVAQAAPCVKGVIHVQNQPVAVLDLKEALGIDAGDHSSDEERELILVTKFNKVTTAFLIDGISKIHRTSWDKFAPINNSMADEEDTGFTTGTVTLDDNIIIILDLERLMLTHFPSANTHTIDDVRIPQREGRENIRIAYAEDSKMVRSITESILKDAGYKSIRSFENGKTAYEHLQAESLAAKAEGETLIDRIDLVLTDIEMPMMDGLTLCKKVKSELSSVELAPKVIVYSSLISKEMSVKCHSVGTDAQLAKPEVEQIVELIDSLCLDKIEA